MSSRRSELNDSDIHKMVDDAKEKKRKSKHTRDRSWDATRVRATYDIPSGLRERIKEIANEENVRAYDIARLFLEHGVSLWERDGLDAFDVEKRPTEYTFFSEDD